MLTRGTYVAEYINPNGVSQHQSSFKIFRIKINSGFGEEPLQFGARCFFVVVLFLVFDVFDDAILGIYGTGEGSIAALPVAKAGKCIVGFDPS